MCGDEKIKKEQIRRFNSQLFPEQLALTNLNGEKVEGGRERGCIERIRAQTRAPLIPHMSHTGKSQFKFEFITRGNIKKGLYLI